MIVYSCKYTHVGWRIALGNQLTMISNALCIAVCPSAELVHPFNHQIQLLCSQIKIHFSQILRCLSTQEEKKMKLTLFAPRTAAWSRMERECCGFISSSQRNSCRGLHPEMNCCYLPAGAVWDECFAPICAIGSGFIQSEDDKFWFD